jgi:hypothetical protein
MATRGKVSKKRASAKATRKVRAKNVKTAALVKRLSRKGGGKREQVASRARKAGMVDPETEQLSPRAVKKWTG